MSLKANAYEKRGLQHLARTAAAVVLISTVCASALALHLRIAAAVGNSASQAASAPAARIASGVMAGDLFTRVQPTYQPVAKEAKVSGAVVLQAIIGG